MANVVSSKTKEIKAHSRTSRKVHSGGRVKGDLGHGGKEKLTTTLRVHAKRQLEDLAQQHGIGLGNAIELLLHAQRTGATFEEVIALLAPEGHLESVAERNQMIEALLAGEFKNLELVE